MIFIFYVFVSCFCIIHTSADMLSRRFTFTKIIFHKDILSQRHSFANTFFRKHILSQTHSFTNTFIRKHIHSQRIYVKGSHLHLCVMFLMCQPDEYRTKHCEYVRLNESHEKLETVHEQQHYDAEGVQTESEAYAH